MKTFKILSAALLVGLMTSCGGNTAPKNIEPSATEFTSGELAKYIEIQSEASELTFANVDGAIPTEYIRLSVPVKLVKEGFKDVDPRDISFTSLLAVAIVELQDENGIRLTDIDIQDDECLKLKKLLTMNEGATETLVFEGEFHGSDAKKWFEKTVSYKPTLSANIQIKGQQEESTTTVASSSSDSGASNFDELLAAYESYIDKLIEVNKKIKDGDIDAVAEYGEIMEEAQEYSNKLTAIQGTLTPKQIKQFTEVSMKISKIGQ